MKKRISNLLKTGAVLSLAFLCAVNLYALPPVTITLASATQIAAGSVNPGSLRNTVYTFTLNPSGATNLTGFNFTTNSGYVAADVTKMQLWYSTTNSLPGATQISTDITTSLGPGSHSFAAFTQALSAGVNNYFWVTADIAASAAAANTITVAAVASANFTVSTGSFAGSTTAGGTQTISSCALDQSQLAGNSGTGISTHMWESFTAGKSGYLCQIDMIFNNTNYWGGSYLNTTGTLNIYSGTGNGGALLATQSIVLDGSAYPIATNWSNGWMWAALTITTPPSVTSGSVYTFEIIVNTSAYAPYVCCGGGSYTGGVAYDDINAIGPSAWWIFKTYVSSSVLPIELIRFSGYNKDEQNILQWITASENNNDYFIIERSKDGDGFESIGKVEGTGNPAALKRYSFADTHPLTADNYYRLKQVGYDGKFTYSYIIAVTVEQINKSVINVNPNPASTVLNCELYSKEEEPVVIEVHDILGNVVIREEIKTVKGTNAKNLDISSLAQGMYFMEINSIAKQTQIKFVKQ